jgi:hypothetical protein
MLLQMERIHDNSRVKDRGKKEGKERSRPHIEKLSEKDLDRGSETRPVVLVSQRPERVRLSGIRVDHSGHRHQPDLGRFRTGTIVSAMGKIIRQRPCTSLSRRLCHPRLLRLRLHPISCRYLPALRPSGDVRERERSRQREW